MFDSPFSQKQQKKTTSRQKKVLITHHNDLDEKSGLFHKGAN